MVLTNTYLSANHIGWTSYFKHIVYCICMQHRFKVFMIMETFILATLQVSVYLIRQPTKQLIQFVCFYCVYKSL